MIDGFLDISYAEAKKFILEAEKKRGVCRVLPRGRFNISQEGFNFDGLVCTPRDMGGEATGVGAAYCENCISKPEDIGMEEVMSLKPYYTVRDGDWVVCDSWPTIKSAHIGEECTDYPARLFRNRKAAEKLAKSIGGVVYTLEQVAEGDE